MSVPPVSSILARHIAGVQGTRLPELALGAAERSLLDVVGVIIGATGVDPLAGSLADLVVAEGGRPESTVFGHIDRLPATAAALANGGFAHALDFEDALDGLPVHPSAQIVPALLALAEARGLSGADVVRALVVGADLTGRLARAVGNRLADRGWYPPPILGALGAVAAAANLIGLSERGVLDALSLALMQVTASGEIAHSPQSHVRGIRDGFAAHAAVRSVLFAEAGVRGFDAPLEGRSGFFATYLGGPGDYDTLLADLGDDYLGEAIAFKPWPSCRGTHAFVESIIRLRQGIAMDEIESVRVYGGPFIRTLSEPRESKIAPTLPIEAKFSVPYTVASALVDRSVSLSSFTDDALRRPDVLAWSARVEALVDDEFTADGELSGGRTEIRLKDGRVLADTVMLPRGNPAAPLSDSELREKFRQCVSVGRLAMRSGAVERLADELLDLRSQPSVRDVLRDFVDSAGEEGVGA